MTHYETLGVKNDASTDDIRDAFRRLVKEKHPDVCKDAGAEDRFKSIQEANEVLSDESKRREYDLSLVQEKIDREPEDLIDLLMDSYDFTPKKKKKSSKPKVKKTRMAGVPDCDEIPDGVMPDDTMGGIF